MRQMGEQDLSRRQILTGVVAAGGAGALGGRGTTALLSDRETFSNNSIQGSASTAGIVDLEVDVGSINDALGIVYSINLPEGINNNPSYIWVQVNKCPIPTGHLENIGVDLRVECASQPSPYVIISGSLLDVVNELRESGGEQLLCSDTEDQRCFEPGDDVDVVLEVDRVDEAISGTIEFEFEFYGEQCRYNDGSESPFTPLDPCDGGTSTPGQAISWIAFCSLKSDLSASMNVVTTDDDDDPTSVDWSTTHPVDYVLIKSGQNYTIYDYGEDSDRTEGTVTSGGDPDADFYGRASGGAASGFGNTPSSTFGNDSGTGNTFGNTPGNNSVSSNPCELAADVVGDGTFNDGTSLKLEWDGNEFNEDN